MLKKVLSLFLVLTLVLSMGVAAFAADEVIGEGDTTYVDTDKFVFLLPTDNAWDFTLDPQGLVGAYKAGLFDDAGTAGVTSNDLIPYKGKIIAGDYAPVAVNKSSYKTTLGVKIKVESDAVLLTEGDNVEVDTENNVIINALLSDDSVIDQTATFGVTSPVKVPLSETEQTLGFVLENPDYKYLVDGTGKNFDYVIADVDSGFGTQIQLGGEVNPTADWSDFAGTNPTKEISVTAKFSFTKSTDEEIALPVTNGTYGYVGLLGDPTPTEIGFTSASAISPTEIEITEAAGVISIPFYSNNDPSILQTSWGFSGTYYEVTDMVTLTNSAVEIDLTGWGADTYEFTIWMRVPGHADANEDGDVAFKATITIPA